MGALGLVWVLASLLPDSAVGEEGFSKGQLVKLIACLNITEQVPAALGLWSMVRGS